MRNRKPLAVFAGLLMFAPFGASAMDECDAALQRYLLDDTKVTDQSSRALALNAAACAEDSTSSGGSVGGSYDGIGGSADYQEARRSKKCDSSSRAENDARFYAYASRSIKSELVQAWSQCKAQRVDGLFCNLLSDDSSTSARLRVVWRNPDQATVTSSMTSLMNLPNRKDRSVFDPGSLLSYGVTEFIVEKEERDLRKEGKVVINVTSGHKADSCSAVWPPYRTPAGEEGPACGGLRTKINEALQVLHAVPLGIMNCWDSPDSNCQQVIARVSASDRDKLAQTQRMLTEAFQPLQGMSRAKALDLYGACSISESYGRFSASICINANPLACMPIQRGLATAGGPSAIPVPGGPGSVPPSPPPSPPPNTTVLH